MSFGEVEHFSTMLAGCESINSGNALTPDGHYAFAVLKVHAQDEGLIAGQEGFLDSIKKGAQKTGEFFIKLFKAIRDWFRNLFPNANRVIKQINDKTTPDKLRPLGKVFSSTTSQLESLDTEDFKTWNKEVNANIDFEDLFKSLKKVTNVFDLIEDDDEYNVDLVKRNIGAVLDGIEKVSGKFVGILNKLEPKKEDQSNKLYEKGVSFYKTFGEISNNVTSKIVHAIGI